MSRRTRTGMTVDDEFLLGDEYDTDLLQSDSLTSQILASKDPTVAALMKQQKAKTQFELKKQGAIFGGIDLLATGLTAAISPTLREAGRESKRIQAQKRAGTLGAEAFKETLRQSKAIVGGAETAASRAGLAALASKGQGNLKQQKVVQKAAEQAGRDAEVKALALAEQARQQDIAKDLSKFDSIQQFFQQTGERLVGSLVKAGAGLASFLGAAKAYEGTKDLPKVAAELKKAFPDLSDAEVSSLLDRFTGASDEERGKLIDDLQSAFGARADRPAEGAAAEGAAAPAAVTPAAPAAPQPREVDGAGGYRYRQDPDGTVTIIGAPSTRQDAIGRSYSATDSIGQAITTEIGAYEAPQTDQGQAASAEGQAVIDSVRQAQVGGNQDLRLEEARAMLPPGLTPQQQMEALKNMTGFEADRNITLSPPNTGAPATSPEQALQRAQGQVPVVPATQPGFLGAATGQELAARQPDHYSSAPDLSSVGPRGEFVKLSLGDQVVYLNSETNRFHLGNPQEDFSPGTRSYSLQQLDPSIRQQALTKVQQASQQQAQPPAQQAMTRMTDEQRDAMRPTKTGGPAPAPAQTPPEFPSRDFFDRIDAARVDGRINEATADYLKTLPRDQAEAFLNAPINQDPALRQPEAPAQQGLDIGLTPGQNVLAATPAAPAAPADDNSVVDTVVAAMLPGATEQQVAAGIEATGGEAPINPDIIVAGILPNATAEQQAAAQAELNRGRPSQPAAAPPPVPAPAPAPAPQAAPAPIPLGSLENAPPMEDIGKAFDNRGNPLSYQNSMEAYSLYLRGGLSNENINEFNRVMGLALTGIMNLYSKPEQSALKQQALDQAIQYMNQAQGR